MDTQNQMMKQQNHHLIKKKYSQENDNDNIESHRSEEKLNSTSTKKLSDQTHICPENVKESSKDQNLKESDL